MTPSLLLERSALTGRQEPRVCSHPGTGVASAAAEVIELCESAGFYLDPWQKIALEVIFSERADGK